MSLQDFIYTSINTFLSLGKIVIKSKFGIKYPKYKANECLIIGNGPSAAITLASDFVKQNEIIKICVNHFASTPDYQRVKPEVYILLDPAFADSNHELSFGLILNLVKNTSWNLDLYIPTEFAKNKNLIAELKKNSHISLVFFNYTIIESFEAIENTLFGLNLGMLRAQNVLVCSLFLALRLNFKTIYLTGADHNWHENLKVSDDDNSLILNDSHFYGERNRNLTSEFGNRRSIESEIAKQFISLYKVFKGHERLAKYAQLNKADIINISNHSVIDVYRRDK